MSSKELARASALDRLQRVSMGLRKQFESVELLEQDGTLTKEEAEAEKTRLAAEKAAAKTAYKIALQRIEVGDYETDLAAAASEERALKARASKAPKRARADDREPSNSPQAQSAPPPPPVPPPAPPVPQGQALRELRVQQLQRRAEEAAMALKAATEGDPELIAFEQRLEHLAAEEKKKGPSKHFTSLAWRRSCVAMIEIFQFGVLKSARKMAHLLDEDGVSSSWERQFASLKNWRRAFAAGKLGHRYV